MHDIKKNNFKFYKPVCLPNFVVHNHIKLIIKTAYNVRVYGCKF